MRVYVTVSLSFSLVEERHTYIPDFKIACLGKYNYSINCNMSIKSQIFAFLSYCILFLYARKSARLCQGVLSKLLFHKHNHRPI